MKKDIFPNLAVGATALMLIILIFVIAAMRADNIKLNSHIRILETNIAFLNDALKQFQAHTQTQSRTEDNALAYLRWRYVLKDQVALARKRLLDKASEIKNLKKDKDALRLNQ